MGNAFVACGVIYCIDEYTKTITSINFAFDTKTGKQWNPDIRFLNEYNYNSMVDYNPKEKVLYAWDSGHQVTYSLTFDGAKVPMISAFILLACTLVAAICYVRVPVKSSQCPETTFPQIRLADTTNKRQKL